MANPKLTVNWGGPPPDGIRSWAVMVASARTATGGIPVASPGVQLSSPALDIQANLPTEVIVTANSTVIPGILTVDAVGTTGLTGATAASRYVGATTSGAPASGTFVIGDFVIDQTGQVWICTVAGSPGTWAGAPATGLLSVKSYGAKGNGTTDDTVAVQAAFNAASAQPMGGVVYFPSGTYLISGSGLTVPPNVLRITGNANTGNGASATTVYGSALVSTTGPIINDGFTNHHQGIEIDHLMFKASAGHCVSGMNMTGNSHIHHLRFIANGNNVSAWDHDGSVVSTVPTYNFNNHFSDIEVQVFGSSRTVPAFNFYNLPAANMTGDVFERITFNNIGNDNQQYLLAISTATSVNGSSYDNTIQSCEFSQAYGGAIHLSGAAGCRILNVDVDNYLIAQTLNNSAILIDTPSGSRRSSNILISGYNIDTPPSGSDGQGSTWWDIQLDGTVDTVLIEGSGASAKLPSDGGLSSNKLYVNVGSTSTNVIILGTQTAVQVDNPNTDTMVLSAVNSKLRFSNAAASGTFGDLALFTNTTSGPASAPIGFIAAAAGNRVLGFRVSGDTGSRLNVFSDGSFNWGAGGGGQDVKLARTGTGAVTLNDNSNGNAATLQVSASGHNLDTVVIGGADSDITVAGTEIVTNAPVPAVGSMLAWNFDPALASSSGSSLIAGTVYAMRIDTLRTVTVGHLWFFITNAGSGGTASENFIGLYDSAGNQIAQAGIDSSVTGSGTQKIAVSANIGQSLTLPPGIYYVMILMVASGMPSLLRGGTVAGMNIGTAGANLRGAVNATSKTSLDSPATLGSNVATNAFPFWVGLAS